MAFIEEGSISIKHFNKMISQHTFNPASLKSLEIAPQKDICVAIWKSQPDEV
jgi:hypothetical protein